MTDGTTFDLDRADSPDSTAVQEAFFAEIAERYPERQGGLALRLMEHLHERARALGYRRLRLDTGSNQPEAYRLYASLGYREIADYNGNGLASFWFEREI